MEKEPKTYVLVPRWVMRLIVVTLLTALLSPWGMFAYVTYVNGQRIADEQENDREWCDLVVFYTDYYRENPPATELQKQQFALMERRRISLDCK